ncbi:serine hydrolase domain-containing protein [Altererythrobacter sp. GH1-8]|uniref:serine hydrolase domain-containing protein n=1 Tax=Altererythrobacter sp. GH1-8 TaxID=3349333 RepID=UPI00374D1302
MALVRPPCWPAQPCRGCQLLNYTSGIASYTSIPGWMNPDNMARSWTTAEMIEVFKDRPSDFAPGERYLYNNSGYILVGAVIEAVTGKSWDQVVVEQISQPLGLSSIASFADEATTPGMAIGYTSSGDGSIEEAVPIHASVPAAAGGLRGNVLDLSSWGNALHGGEVLGDALYLQMISRTVLNDASTVNYGFGLDVETFRGRASIGHGGGINGFNTASTYLPEDDIFVAVLNNTDSPDVSANFLMAKIAAMALGDPFEDFTQVNLDLEAVAALLGEYKINEGESRKFYERDGKLYTLRTGGGEGEVFPAGEDRFFYGPNSLTWFAITRDAEGVLQMEMHQNGASTAEVAKWIGPVKTAPEVVISPETLTLYAGSYTSEIGTLLLAVGQDGALTAKLNAQPVLTLVPQSETEFQVQGVDASVRLVVEQGGPVTAVIGQGGQEMRLEREAPTD